MILTVDRSYMHLHSLNRTLRTVAAIIRVVVDVCGYTAHSARWRSGRAAHSWSRLLAIIERLNHTTCIWTCFWQQEVVLEDLIVVCTNNASVQHLWPIVLQVLHKPCLCVVHQIVLVRRAARIFRIVEARGGGVGIGTEVIDVEILVDSHHVTISVACVIEWSVCVTTNGSASVRKFASSVGLVRLV